MISPWYTRFSSALAALLLIATTSQALDPDLRKQILDAVRPPAAAKAGQPVLIRVDRLNVDKDWAVLVGSLVSTSGTELDWNKAKDCHPDLDKMLWAVVHRTGTTWKIQQLDICACEPPYWGLSLTQLTWPCGVYEGLSDGGVTNLADQCRQQRRKK
jgi:hypothetical protein